jgi:diguanylate cyclase (GGDEF)-like protein/putative nucleotidyltransferase with HDIG domain
MSIKARLYISLVSGAGLALIVYQLGQWRLDDPLRFALYLGISLLGSGLKVSLPAVTGTMSVSFLFFLIALMSLPLPELLLIVAGATAAQTLWHAKSRPKLYQIVFNLASGALAIGAAYLAYSSGVLSLFEITKPLKLGVAGVVYFIANTGQVALVIALTEHRSPRRIWLDSYFWCFPYYLVGSSIAGACAYLSRWVGWQAPLMALPVVYVIYRSYRLYLGRLEGERDHAEQMASLHLRTIEALALAIDAKDHTTHDHLERVHVYAVEIARELDLPKEQIQALQAAALLHDIGKLAVPEHIISKPGKLTAEEFEKMKIHPVVGAKILDRVKFPYPVVPIVQAHHEKWNGTGYPYGLKGEEIPIGARILSAVDCLDALSSDRQYRRALPLDQAMLIVSSEKGKSLDPKVVEILERRYRELEHIVVKNCKRRGVSEQNFEPVVEQSVEPAAGLESARPAVPRAGAESDFLSSIAAARQEAQGLFELAQTLGNSLALNDTLSVLATRLRRLVPYDTIAVYVVRNGMLKAEYVNGEDSRLFGSLEIPIGQGLSGWVAETRKAIINGNPAVEPGYLNDPLVFSKLNSALAVPLESSDGVVGVLALYQIERDAFSRDELRILQAVASKLSVAIENALKFQQAETSAVTDYLTALPNARSLFVHLEGEIARCVRSNARLAVLVCDLDGFKQVNDRFGHLAGNQVLSLVAAGFRERCRETDYAARMGGDEFVMVLPGITADAVRQRVQELGRMVTRAGVEVCHESILSLSIGEAFFPDDGKNAEEILAEADRRMYRQKREHKRQNPLLPRTETVPISLLVN